jgi:3-methyladenine DNA glycosylase AlkC
MFTEGWSLWPIGRYVEKHDVENIPVSLEFISELTKRFTWEFIMRPIIVSEPKKTMKLLIVCGCNSNVHVRRLSSECM